MGIGGSTDEKEKKERTKGKRAEGERARATDRQKGRKEETGLDRLRYAKYI